MWESQQNYYQQNTYKWPRCMVGIIVMKLLSMQLRIQIVKEEDRLWRKGVKAYRCIRDFIPHTNG